ALFFFQAEDGIRDFHVTGVQTCALPISARTLWSLVGTSSSIAERVTAAVAPDDPVLWLLRERSKDRAEQVRWMFRVIDLAEAVRSEERRVGKGGRGGRAGGREDRKEAEW